MENRFKLARTLYNQHGLQSTKDVANETTITKSLIEDLESNVGKARNVGYLTIRKLAEYYGVSADYLLGLSGVPSKDATIQAVHDFTGLSQSAIMSLHTIRDNKKYMEIISALLSHKALPALLDYVIEMETAKLEGELGRQSESIGDGRIIRGYEHEVFLEYMTDLCFKTIISDTANEIFEGNWPVEEKWRID